MPCLVWSNISAGGQPCPAIDQTLTMQAANRALSLRSYTTHSLKPKMIDGFSTPLMSPTTPQYPMVMSHAYQSPSLGVTGWVSERVWLHGPRASFMVLHAGGCNLLSQCLILAKGTYCGAKQKGFGGEPGLRVPPAVCDRLRPQERERESEGVLKSRRNPSTKSKRERQEIRKKSVGTLFGRSAEALSTRPQKVNERDRKHVKNP